MDSRSLDNRETPQDLYTRQLQRHPQSQLFVEAPGVVAAFQLHRRRRADHRSDPGHAAARPRARQQRYWSPTFCGVCDPEKRDNDDEFAKATYFKSTKGTGSHNMVFGYDIFNDKRFANNHQSGQRLPHHRHHLDHPRHGASDVIYPQLLGDGTTVHAVQSDRRRQPGHELPDAPVFYNDKWRVNTA